MEVKLMNGFGFIEYEDSMDARDVVPAYHGSTFMGNRLVVQFARSNRQREQPFFQERAPPRTRRTIYRMAITGLNPDTSWQDLKDFARQDGLDVVYSEVARERDGKGFVEYETADDLDTAVGKIDGTDFKGSTVQCTKEIQSERPRERHRSRSPPPPRRGYGGPPAPGGYDDYYGGRRGPPRGYSPRGYRDRSPPRRDYYESRDRYGRSPPGARGRPPMDDYPPPRRNGYPDEPYPPPPRSGYGGRPPPYAEDPYMNGHRGGYERPFSPRGRPRSPPGRGAYDGGYDRRGYW
ncbi:MAG: hypothetical protein M1828_001846 [Chrysothrix sp. TS-e1954]|nr:MAG: hypothetical protein M1828_001846 [Chrysothrix sp. TS-e1954]